MLNNYVEIFLIDETSLKQFEVYLFVHQKETNAHLNIYSVELILLIQEFCLFVFETIVIRFLLTLITLAADVYDTQYINTFLKLLCLHRN